MIKKDLILISAHCNTEIKKDILRNLVNQILSHKEKFDIMIVSHTIIPEDIAKNVEFAIYDSKNELLYDWDLRSKPWFNPNNDRAILSIYTGFFNTHLAIWRMVIIGNSLAKNCGYNKVHHIEYDTSIKDFTELYDNSNLLEKYDCVTYTKTVSTVDNILFGTYQSYRLDKLSDEFLILNEDFLINRIRNSIDKSPEAMCYEILHKNGSGYEKNKRELDKNGNQFGVSHSKIISEHTAWCLPYHDDLTGKLGFIVWNCEENSNPVEVLLIYNDDKVINLGTINHNHWRLLDIDDYLNSKKLTVILNGKIRNIFEFDKIREEFKKSSFREKYKKI